MVYEFFRISRLHRPNDRPAACVDEPLALREENKLCSMQLP